MMNVQPFGSLWTVIFFSACSRLWALVGGVPRPRTTRPIATMTAHRSLCDMVPSLEIWPVSYAKGHPESTIKASRERSLDLRRAEVDPALLHVGVEKLDPYLFPHVHPGLSLDHATLDGRAEDPDICPLVRGAGHDSVELLADPVLQEEGGGRLPDQPLDLVGVVLLLRTVAVAAG